MEREIEWRRKKERGREERARCSPRRRRRRRFRFIVPSCIRCIKNVTSFNGPILRQRSLGHSSSVSLYSGLRPPVATTAPRGIALFVSRSTARYRYSNDERVLVYATANHSFPITSYFIFILVFRARPLWSRVGPRNATK